MFGMGTGVASSELPPGKTFDPRASGRHLTSSDCASSTAHAGLVWDCGNRSVDLTSSRRVAIARVATGPRRWSRRES